MSGMVLAAWGGVGLVAGWVLRRVLDSAPYRYSDEVDAPRRRPDWLIPVVAVGFTSAAVFYPDHVGVVLALSSAFTWMAGLAAIDLDVRRLPDAWTLPAIPVAAALAAAGAWWSGTFEPLWSALLSGLIMSTVYFALAFMNPAGLGLGDVKLAIPLGILTGWFGSTVAVSAFLAAFVIGLIWGLAVAIQTGEGRKATFPFGPPMLLGAALAVLFLGGLPS